MRVIHTMVSDMPEKKKAKVYRKPDNMRSIHQSVMFSCTPHELYAMLMNSELHSAFTGAEADISSRETGKFTAYDGWIEGKNLELVPDKKIVQRWRAEDWPKGHYSLVTFEFFPQKYGAKLIFTQKEVPKQFSSEIEKGWKEHYWEKMKAMLEKQ